MKRKIKKSPNLHIYNDNREKLRLSTTLTEKTSFPQICKYIDYRVRGWGWEHRILPSLTWKPEGNIETVGWNSCKTQDQNIKQSKHRERQRVTWHCQDEDDDELLNKERRWWLAMERGEMETQRTDIESEKWEKYRIFRP